MNELHSQTTKREHDDEVSTKIEFRKMLLRPCTLYLMYDQTPPFYIHILFFLLQAMSYQNIQFSTGSKVFFLLND